MQNIKPNFKSAVLDELLPQLTAHNQGTKRVFIRNEETDSALTQFAHATLNPGEQSGLHVHDTMDEYFYFLSGIGTYVINEKEVEVSSTSFSFIPAGASHNLVNTGNQPLQFVYFGISVDEKPTDNY